jgi:excisionase family DNA binding protein
MGKLPELMTVAQVAEALMVSDETIHRWSREGRLPVVRLPGGRPGRGLKRFRRADVEALINGDNEPVAS